MFTIKYITIDTFNHHNHESSDIQHRWSRINYRGSGSRGVIRQRTLCVRSFSYTSSRGNVVHAFARNARITNVRVRCVYMCIRMHTPCRPRTSH